MKGIASPREIWTNGEVIIKDAYSKFRGVLKDTANNTVAWVGSAVVNGCDNYDEYACGEIDGWRAISEWGAETLADVGKVVLAVGVSTVVCATVAAAAPVIAAAATSTLAVGATAVVLCATADFFVSKFTDKGDVGELVSDKVLDLINQGADLFYDKVIARGE